MVKVVKALAGVAWLGAAAFDAVVVRSDGFWSLLPPFKTLHEGQLFMDLSIGLGLCCAWMVLDARARGRAAVGWGFVVATIALGSLGPLAYLVLAWQPGRETRYTGA